jgi:hypothetical protein
MYDTVMEEYGRRFRENKEACERILGPLKESDLKWLRQHCWPD